MEQLITCKICFENKNTNITPFLIYTSEDLKPHTYGGERFKSLLVSDPKELKCTILILRWFKTPIFYENS
jgi:hypothetical protein